MKQSQILISISVGILTAYVYTYHNSQLFSCVDLMTDYHNRFYSIFTEAPNDLKINLAKINLTEAQTNFNKVANEVRNAFEVAGFAYLVSVPGFEPDDLLRVTKWFFNLPQERKHAIMKSAFKKDNANAFRGYYPVKPGTHSYKEAFEMGTFEHKGAADLEDNQVVASGKSFTEEGRPLMRSICCEGNSWPESGEADKDEEFKRIIRKQFNVYTKASELFMELCAVGLGFERNHFVGVFSPHPLSTFRLLHYPSRIGRDDEIPEDAKDGDVRIVTGEHHDSTMLTLLATFEYAGLQIKPHGVKHWLDVPAEKNSLVVNIGALLQTMVNGKFVATNHRVIDIGADRYSVPLFYEPDFDADISKTVDGKENLWVGKYHKYGPWMTNRTSQFYEYATTDFGVAN